MFFRRYLCPSKVGANVACNYWCEQSWICASGTHYSWVDLTLTQTPNCGYELVISTWLAAGFEPLTLGSVVLLVFPFCTVSSPAVGMNLLTLCSLSLLLLLSPVHRPAQIVASWNERLKISKCVHGSFCGIEDPCCAQASVISPFVFTFYSRKVHASWM